MKIIQCLFLGIAFCILNGCENGNTEPDPTCSDGIKNGNETGIDCGGDCDPCFECLTINCSLLSGATSDQTKTSIKWKSVLSGGDGTIPDDGSWKFTFYSDGTAIENDMGVSAVGTWAFDDPVDPEEVVVTYNSPPDGWGDYGAFPLLRLDEDTLGLHSGTWKYFFIKE